MSSYVYNMSISQNGNNPSDLWQKVERFIVKRLSNVGMQIYFLPVLSKIFISYTGGKHQPFPTPARH